MGARWKGRWRGRSGEIEVAPFSKPRFHPSPPLSANFSSNPQKQIIGKITSTFFASRRTWI